MKERELRRQGRKFKDLGFTPLLASPAATQNYYYYYYYYYLSWIHTSPSNGPSERIGSARNPPTPPCFPRGRHSKIDIYDPDNPKITTENKRRGPLERRNPTVAPPSSGSSPNFQGSHYITTITYPDIHTPNTARHRHSFL
ncbi:hypothetical protein K449DRAFT_120814 [Hypoxylon sp. EC38]|nr:hypothetical protein K449DRAFT_120814 [Hypoxylon sp. EC38]